MIFDLDAALARLSQWDFTVKVGGKNFPTRAMSLADLERLGNVGSRGDQALRDALIDLFPGEVPPIQSMDSQALAYLSSAVIGAIQGQIAKNSRRVMDAARADMAREVSGAKD